MRVRQLAMLIPVLMFCYSAAAGISPAKEDIALVVDNSSSMKQLDENLAIRDAIKAFLEHISRDVKVALILFDDNASLKMPFVPVIDEHVGDLLKVLQRIDYGGRFSNSAAAIERALHELHDNGRRGAGKSIILFTQGGIDTGNEAVDVNFSKWLSDVLTEEAAQARIRIFCIAFSGTADTGVLQNLAQRTGGEFYPLTSSSEIPMAFDNLAADIFSIPSMTSIEALAANSGDKQATRPPSDEAPQTIGYEQAPDDGLSPEPGAEPESDIPRMPERSAAGTDSPSSALRSIVQKLYDWAIRNWMLILGLAVAIGLLGATSKLRRQKR